MQIKKRDGAIYVYGYSRIFTKKAPHIRKGKFKRSRDGIPYWEFPESSERQVRKLLLETFGENGLPVDMVDIDVDLDTYQAQKSKFIMLGDVTLAVRGERNKRVDLHDNASVIKGSFLPYGGSRSSPVVSFEPGTVIRMKYPEKMYYEKLEGKPGISLISSPADA